MDSSINNAIIEKSDIRSMSERYLDCFYDVKGTMLDDDHLNINDRVGPYIIDRLMSMNVNQNSRIYLARDLRVDIKVAIKVVAKTFNSNELKIMKRIDHPNIVRLLDYVIRPKYIYLIMEYLEEDLFTYLERKKILTEEEYRSIFRGILSAMKYLKKMEISHCDIKLQNIMLAKSGKPKLIDFGFSVVCPYGSYSKYCGTKFYVAPEILALKPYNPYKADVFSLGIVSAVCLTGQYPFLNGIYSKIDEKVFTGLPYHTKTLLRSMLEIDPERRITISKLCYDDWVVNTIGSVKLIKSGLVLNYHIIMLCEKYGLTKTILLYSLRKNYRDFFTSMYYNLLFNEGY